MTRRTPVFFICAPHSRTGVTTAARLLTDYFLSRRTPIEGFDTDSREPTYAELFPQTTHVVDVGEVKGQISLFDRLLTSDETPRIVDVWHRSYEQLFSTIEEIGFFEEARRNNVEPIVLFQADATASAAANAKALLAAWPDLWMAAVHNEGAAPLGAAAYELLSRHPARGKFVIPRLESPIDRVLDDESLSLSQFFVEPPPDMSIVVRAALKGWLTPIFTQFQSFEMRLELEYAEALR